ncbi:hypothetical protein GUJ93_ZPchr0006g46179 [Zizania palustris]|uniref:Remorin C-terminal domain-containing protein n=1 Tax=Zizania palustris TaxID=103762 RepID=A0A8J5VTN0_ZIZPA|nr:hypothetical protein GUJ93_ZPchr0006g46179 [Zizania palustris]
MRRSPQGKSSVSRSGASARRYETYSARSTSSNLLACYARTKPRPSKWDDAQKWLSRAATDDEDGPRRSSSAAADGLLLPLAPRKGRTSWRSWSNADGESVPAGTAPVEAARDVVEGDTKRVDSVQAYERRPCVVSVRDVGTEMTPGGSKEPSRANTPRAAAPAVARPTAAHVARAAATPGRRQCDDGSRDNGRGVVDLGAAFESVRLRRDEAASARTPLSPATAWGEAERAKYMARYRCEEMKIQAWENRERRKAERQMRAAEEKAERTRLRAQARTAGKLATAQAHAKARRARAEAELALGPLAAAGGRGGKGGCLLTRSASWSSGRSLSLRLPLLCS